MSTPREQGFSMPPEWAPHERCWMAWPCRPELWGDRMAAARRTYAEVAKAIAQFEPVTMIARPELIAEASLQCGKGISILPMEYDDSWTRDTAPSFVRDASGALAGVDGRFDGYGGRAPGFAADARLAERICERLQVPRFEAPLVLEGGAVHVDGEGTCLACAASVLDPRRNPGLERPAAERLLGEYLGVAKVVWLERGLVDDETGGHIDNLACFAAPGKVLALTCRDPEDAHHEILRQNLERLRAERDAQGRELEVLEIEQPAARFRADGRRLTLSYINFYIANGAVVMPMFDDALDEPALKALTAAFPNHEVVEIEVSDLVYGGGAIHCITQQQPSREPA